MRCDCVQEVVKSYCHFLSWTQLSEVYQFNIEDEEWVEVGSVATVISNRATHWID